VIYELLNTRLHTKGYRSWLSLVQRPYKKHTQLIKYKIVKRRKYNRFNTTCYNVAGSIRSLVGLLILCLLNRGFDLLLFLSLDGDKCYVQLPPQMHPPTNLGDRVRSSTRDIVTSSIEWRHRTPRDLHRRSWTLDENNCRAACWCLYCRQHNTSRHISCIGHR